MCGARRNLVIRIFLAAMMLAVIDFAPKLR
jgi:hypothetical protein